MPWIKKGLIYTPSGKSDWRHSSALTPTPLLIDDDTIRVFTGFRDPNGISRIGYVDVSSTDPSRLLRLSEEPVLELGQAGCFDDNGMILGDLIRVGNEIRMYYVGFQIADQVKFLAFSGLALSRDGGDSFERHSQAPILDRSDEGLFIRAIHSVQYEHGRYRIWYAADDGWENIDGTPYPRYHIMYADSDDGIHFAAQGTPVILPDKNNQEYRIGRPRVYKRNDRYIMNFTYGTIDGRYQAGQATSIDATSWQRDDSQLGIDLSEQGWDSLHLSYPAVLRAGERWYMFYNGNHMGRDGFGYAVLEEA